MSSKINVKYKDLIEFSCKVAECLISIRRDCMSVRNWFTIEIYGFTQSLLCFLACAIHGVIRTWTQRIEDDVRPENKSRDIEDG